MNEEMHIHEGPLCHVSFKRSSTKDAGLGYDIDVSAGCSEVDADATFAIALRLKERADDAVRPTPLIKQMEESIAALA